MRQRNTETPERCDRTGPCWYRPIRRDTAVYKQMIGNDSRIIEDEKLIADRRTAVHHHRENQRQHQNVQDRFEQRPPVAELGVAEPGPGLADDQGVNDADLSLQRLKKAGRRPRLPAGAAAAR